MRAAFAAVVAVVAVAIAAPAALGSNGALSQLPGQAACVSDSLIASAQAGCQQAVGIGVIQSIAISHDGNSLYTASPSSKAVAAFSRNASTGLLTQVPGAGGCIQDPTATAEPGCTRGAALQTPDWVTVSPNDLNVYASSFGSNAVDVFSRDTATGGLTQLSGSAGCLSSDASQTSCSPAVGLQGPGVITVSPDGKNAYLASFGNQANGSADKGGVAVFSVSSNGSLTQLGGGNGCIVDKSTPVAGCTTSSDGVLRGVGDVEVSPDGNFVYVAARTSGAISIYSRDPSTGALTRVAGPDGCLEETGTSPCAAGQGTPVNGLEGPNSIAISPDGAHVYVASFVNGSRTGTTVAVFSRDSTTGALTESSCFSGAGTDSDCASVPVLDGPFAITTSPDGSSVYVTAYGNNNPGNVIDPVGNAVTVFSADSSGALTPLPGLSQCVSATGSNGNCAQGTGLLLPHQTVLSPDGKFAYVAGHQSSAIDIFATVAPQTAPPSNSGLPTISGTMAVGQTLTGGAGGWNGTQTGYAYQWEDCLANGTGCKAIARATGFSLAGAPATTSYTLTSGDLGHTLRLVVTATNSAGSTTATSAATAALNPPPPSNTAAPKITGTAKVGQRLTVSTGTWTQNPTGFKYQWNDCNTSGGGCTPIPGATSNARTLTAGDAGHKITATVTASNAGGSSSATAGPTGVVAASTSAGRPSNTALPTISGRNTQGQTLSVSRGSWKNSPTSFKYEWQRCSRTGTGCKKTPGAAASSYKLTATDVGHTIVAVVTASNAGGSASAPARRTAVIAKPLDLISCVPGGKSKGKRKQLKCTVRTVASAKLPRVAKHVTATIWRGKTVYEKGSTVSLGGSGHIQLLLTRMRTLKAGRYTLVLHTRHGRKLVITLTPITVA